MQFHRNAKLGLAGRHQLVLAIESGGSIPQSARTFNVSVATAHRWWKRWRDAGAGERESRSCLFDRSSRPAHSPHRLAPELEEAICACRRQTGWGPRLVAGATGFAHSTVWKVLKRAGISRPPRSLREPANRYEWPCPGDLLHMDTSEYARFQRPGHRVTGDRRSQDRHHRDGLDIVHAVIDDHSRLAYQEIHDDEAAATAAGSLERALAFYARPWQHRQAGADRQRLGLHPKPRLFSAPRPRARSSTSPASPTAPVATGKVERFQQTMAREWAYGLVYRSHHERADALPHWLQHY